MRELIVVAEQSTPESLVFTFADAAASDGDVPTGTEAPTPDAAPADSADATGEDRQYFYLAVDDRLRSILTSGSVDVDTPAASTDSATDTEPANDATEAQPPRVSREPDPRLSSPLSMTPREIQTRIRAGASVAELAAECDVPESRIDPFAYPVLLERQRIADVAKQAHPVRDDGPAPLTLWEVLATALAARGNDLTTSEWDAYRESTGQWVVLVTWVEGHTKTTSEWSYHRQGTTNATVIARNSVAAALLDPDFGRPARTTRPLASVQDGPEDTAPAAAHTPEENGGAHDEQASGQAKDDDFLQHPDQAAPRRPRRRAVTPHWEDVLLGVRTNTKRPRK